MGTKIKNLINYVKGLPAIIGSPLSFVRAFGYLIVFTCLFYLLLMIQAIYFGYQEELSFKGMMRLEVFIPIIIGAGAVSSVEKVSKLWIDKNHNQIPDALEEEEKNESIH